MPPADEKLFELDKDVDGLAITFTLNFNYINKKYNVKLQYEDYEVQKKICMEYLQKVLCTHVKYIIIPECTKIGNWHAHGILKKVSKDFKHKGFAKIKRNLGNICIKPISNLKKWIEYITKDGSDDYIYNDNYDLDHKIPNISFSRILKREAEYYKTVDVKKVFTKEDFDCYKIAKARSHVMAAARMFKNCKKSCKPNCKII